VRRTWSDKWTHTPVRSTCWCGATTHYQSQATDNASTQKTRIQLLCYIHTCLTCSTACIVTALSSTSSSEPDGSSSCDSILASRASEYLSTFKCASICQWDAATTKQKGNLQCLEKEKLKCAKQIVAVMRTRAEQATCSNTRWWWIATAFKQDSNICASLLCM
jgi:hypothetical protein